MLEQDYFTYVIHEVVDVCPLCITMYCSGNNLNEVLYGKINILLI